MTFSLVDPLLPIRKQDKMKKASTVWGWGIGMENIDEFVQKERNTERNNIWEKLALNL